MAVGEFEVSVESADVSLVSRVLKLKCAGAGIFYKQKLPYRQQRSTKRCSDDDSSKGGNSRYVGCLIRTRIRAQASERISGVTTILFLGFEEAMRSDVAVRVADAARGTCSAQQSPQLRLRRSSVKRYCLITRQLSLEFIKTHVPLQHA